MNYSLILICFVISLKENISYEMLNLISMEYNFSCNYFNNFSFNNFIILFIKKIFLFHILISSEEIISWILALFFINNLFFIN